MTTTDQVEVDSETESATADRATPGNWRWVLLAVALVVAVTGLFAWWQASHDADRDRAESRDAVLIQARQAIGTMNTLDYRSVDQGVKAWTAVTTGTLRDQLAGVSAEDRTLLGEQGKVSTGRVVDASIVDLDGRTATVIAAVEVTVKDGAGADAKSTVKRNRFTADVVKVGETWKLESLQQVAVSLS